MVEAFHNNIIFPNKFTGKEEAQWTHDGHKVSKGKGIKTSEKWVSSYSYIRCE